MTKLSRIGEWKDDPGKKPVRILIIDDSAVMRSFLERQLEGRSGIRVAGALASTTQAFDFLARERVDIVLLDHEMPREKGLEALPRMIEAAKGAHVVMLSSHCQQGSKIAVSALSMGAAEALPKPSGTRTIIPFIESLTELFLRLGATHGRLSSKRNGFPLRPFPEGFRLGCIGVGASTGGIHTLGRLFSGLRRRPGVPILITQHLPGAFIPYYARQVARMTDLPVTVARSGQRIEPDHVYIAPGDSSLSCRSEGDVPRISLLDQRDPITSACPSVNMMFAGIADCFGAGALGIVLTGMGRDGTAGASRIVEAGGAVIAQDSESSIVWGMPGSVTRAGLACANLDPEKMADYVFGQLGSQ